MLELLRTDDSFTATSKDDARAGNISGGTWSSAATRSSHGRYSDGYCGATKHGVWNGGNIGLIKQIGVSEDLESLCSRVIWIVS